MNLVEEYASRALVDAHRGCRAVLRGAHRHFIFRPAHGQCIGAPDAHGFEVKPLEDLHLHAVRCEEFAGMVWVNPDPQAPLRTALGRACDWLAAYELDSWGVTQHAAVRLPDSWEATATDPAQSCVEQIALTRGETSASEPRFVAANDARIGAVTGVDLVAAEALLRGYGSGTNPSRPLLQPRVAGTAVKHQALGEGA
ncbi:MAG: hypothetical protein IPG17_09935 [Sandaracinaceae bacterium]|nr:hypothetical protein [Sandaracinaceae bacterium]MBK6810860.1 hypothetical protein [Sandaracinaceae bacterium]MBK7775536.1 hypothetical protein [Sandaracinaceae bacterium]MBK8406486.1 hypothetical protein [Sandaracinaceae bacterium]MBP7681889.1 hypothetical protein [Deltaproteobacteria bacterium]